MVSELDKTAVSCLFNVFNGVPEACIMNICNVLNDVPGACIMLVFHLGQSRRTWKLICGGRGSPKADKVREVA